MSLLPLATLCDRCYTNPLKTYDIGSPSRLQNSAFRYRSSLFKAGAAEQSGYWGRNDFVSLGIEFVSLGNAISCILRQVLRGI